MPHLRALGVTLLTLALPITFPAASHAQEQAAKPVSSPVVTPAGTLTAIEAMTATVLQEDQSSFSGLAVRVRIQPPQMMKQFELMPTIEWWRNSSTLRPYDIHTTRKDATVGVDARWNFATESFKPYVGAGWGLHFLSDEVNAPSLGVPDQKYSVTKGGLALLGGVSFALSGRLDNFLDLKYHHVTDFRQFKINWGLTYNL